jgi:hypothetical protein
MGRRRHFCQHVGERAKRGRIAGGQGRIEKCTRLRRVRAFAAPVTKRDRIGNSRARRLAIEPLSQAAIA